MTVRPRSIWLLGTVHAKSGPFYPASLQETDDGSIRVRPNEPRRLISSLEVMATMHADRRRTVAIAWPLRSPPGSSGGLTALERARDSRNVLQQESAVQLALPERAKRKAKKKKAQKREKKPLADRDRERQPLPLADKPSSSSESSTCSSSDEGAKGLARG